MSPVSSYWWDYYREPRRSRTNYVCFACRRSVKREWQWDAVACPECGKGMVNMGKRFEVPRRGHDHRWREAALLARELGLA